MNLKKYVVHVVLLCPLIAAACKDTYKTSHTTEHAALVKACDYLWKQQKPDGSWRSPQYAVARAGHAYTPFALKALLDVPDSIYHRDEAAVNRALDFIVKCADTVGRLGVVDSIILEYPNYATAYGLRCLVQVNRPSDSSLIRKMTHYLLSQQFNKATGFDTTSPAFGGWGFGSLILAPGETGHTDIAHTRRIIQALREAGVADPSVFSNAQLYLRYLQRHPSETREQPDVPQQPRHSKRVPYDGGFYYSPIVLGANKGESTAKSGDTDAYFNSYATPTCDGTLALLACGVSVDDERVQAAKKWIGTHPLLDRPEGIPVADAEPWHLALHYYHIMVRAEVYTALKWPGDWKAQIEKLLVGEQNADGSFTNKFSILMKEDDPILATSFGVMALNLAR